MSKPFSIQAPEQIAKDYGGDKQRIAQAAQMGVVDPTTAVLAGMFIDRMRSAQVMEGANPLTVAQQVMGGAPPAQPVPPLPAGGLGGTSPAAPPMAPSTPELGMAEGGIAGLDIPDTMFDEPSNGGFNDGYASGGLVAFSGGGMADLYDSVERVESGGRQSAVSPKGARGVMQLMPGTMRDPGFGVKPMQADTEEENRRVGREYLEAMLRRYGDKETALMAYNWGPGNVDKWIAAGRPANRIPSETRNYVAKITGGGAPKREGGEKLPERDVQSAEGRFGSLMDQMGIARSLYGELPEGGLGELEAFYRKELDPKEQRARRKEDMWATLAQIGASMASSNSPFLLQAVGEAIGAALPGANASRKERLDAERDARKGLQEVLGLKRKEQKEVIEFAKDLRAVELGAEMGEVEMAERRALAEEERAWRSSEAGKEHARSLEQIRAQGAVANSQFEQMVAARRQQIKDRLAQGLPVTNPDGKVVANNKGTLAASEIEVLAQLWAEYDRQRYKPTRQGGVDPMAGALSPQGGGGAEAPIMLGSM